MLALLPVAFAQDVVTERVTGELGEGVKMTFAVDAAPDVVLDALYGDFKAVFPTVTAETLLSETETSRTVRMTEKYLAFESTYVVILTRQDGAITCTEGPDEKLLMRGTIATEAVDDGTQVVYTGFADVPFFPDAWVLDASEKMAPDIAANLRAITAD